MRVAPPPDFESLITDLRADRLMKVLRSGVTENGSEYLHWDKLRHKQPPGGLSHEEWWFALKWGRQNLRREIPLKDASGDSFAYGIPDLVFRLLHYVDQRCSGEIAMPEVVTADEHAR